MAAEGGFSFPAYLKDDAPKVQLLPSCAFGVASVAVLSAESQITRSGGGGFVWDGVHSPHSPRSMKGSVFNDNKVKIVWGPEQCNSFDSSPRRHLRATFQYGKASAADLAHFSAPHALEPGMRCWSLYPACVFTCNVSLAHAVD